MKRIIDWITHRKLTTEGATIDHAPVPVELAPDKSPNWREEKLHEAAKKYDRPFKCAAFSMAREVIVTPGVIAPARACEGVRRKPTPKNVHQLARKG